MIIPVISYSGLFSYGKFCLGSIGYTDTFQGCPGQNLLGRKSRVSLGHIAL